MRHHQLADELPGYIDRARAHFLLDGILARLEEMHAADRVLFGLHPGNVNISPTDEITLVDTELRPPPLPQELHETGPSTPASNIYAFGLVMVEVLEGFSHGPEAEALRAACANYFDASARPTATEARRRLAELGWAGPVTPWQERFEPTDPKERDLIAALAEDADRQVYADWLEQQGFGERAAFVRAELSSDPVAKRDVAVHELAAESDVLWRRAVSRARLLGCWQRPDCPGRWDLMTPRDDTTRSCRTCNGVVTYCATKLGVQSRVGRGFVSGRDLIAVDARVPYAWAHAQYNPPPPSMNPPAPGFNRPPIVTPPAVTPPDGIPHFQPPLANPPFPVNEERPKQESGVLARFLGLFKRD